MNFGCFRLTILSSIFYAKSHLIYSGLLKFLKVCFWCLFYRFVLFSFLLLLPSSASSSHLISSLLKDVSQIIPGTTLSRNIIATFVT